MADSDDVFERERLEVSKVSSAPAFELYSLPWVFTRAIVSTPNFADASPNFFPSLRQMAAYPHGLPPLCYLPRYEKPVAKYAGEGEARNDCVRVALALGANNLLLLDSDCVVRIDTLDRLVGRCKCGIVGAWFMSHDESAPVHVPNQPQGVGLREVEWTGISCMLIHRKVLEAIEPPWFPNGREYGGWQDKIICDKARAKGFPVYVDTDTIVELEDRE